MSPARRAATPDLTTLPATSWQDASVPAFGLLPGQAGVHLGTTAAGQPVSLAAPGPAGSRIAVLGESLFSRLFALRLLGVGARVTAATRVPDQWSSVGEAAGDRLVVTDNVAGWPAAPPAPPTVADGPQALMCDLRRAPPAGLAEGPWRTVLHVTRNAPRRSVFWSTADAVLALDARFAEPVGRLLGEEAARRTAVLAAGEIIVFRPGAAADVLSLDISPGETALLTPGRRSQGTY
ncbi:hypothetical protein [Streptomyces sp. MP131-18]|uniref:hypothetical protein n=1 Tax=Streptomyces sp. MP131-18 TaxID=1857892 RepID=UPI0009C68D08|nr:hypothetical protein [Streptomyces sp. MP131-18]ONK12465.1 hypothetical protein STBA_32070 [Streptomyces sp. MP131-18]